MDNNERRELYFVRPISTGWTTGPHATSILKISSK